MKLIELHIRTIRELCRRYKVKTLSVFGSILTDRFSDSSDIDLLVDFDESIDHHNYADNLLGLYGELRALLGREIDLVDDKAVSNKYFREELNETKHLIYG